MLDEVVGHMTEKVVIPPAEQIKVTERRYTKKKPGEGFKLFAANGSKVPEMVKAGDGYRVHVTGLTHDERGYPAMNVPTQEKMQARLQDKIRDNADKIIRWEEKDLEGAEVVVVSFGITSRVAERAMKMARDQGVKVGSFRLITAWPFPEKQIAELSKKVKAIRRARAEPRPDGPSRWSGRWRAARRSSRCRTRAGRSTTPRHLQQDPEAVR